MNKISSSVTSDTRPYKGITEFKAISALDKQTGDKKQYSPWLEKFKNALDQVDGHYRMTLDVLEKNMDLSKPDKMEEWEKNIREKLGSLMIPEDKMVKIRRDIYTVLIDKVSGDMAVDVQNDERD